jgi:maleate isomerase
MRSLARFRAKWGVIIPSTNIMVERDFAMLCPFGVSFHSGRAYISAPSMTNDAEAKAVLDQMDDEFDNALRDVLTAKPDRIVIAMAAEVMRRGVKAGAEFVEEISQKAQLPVTDGPTAIVAGLQKLGVTRIGILSPYHPESDDLTTSYFVESGYNVVHVEGLRAVSATDIAEISDARIVAGMRAVAAADVEAIVQVGTNLHGVAICAEAERWLGVPAVSMNAATVWHALREGGITDQRDDAGVLLRDF